MERKGIVHELILLVIYFLLDGRIIGCPSSIVKNHGKWILPETSPW